MRCVLKWLNDVRQSLINPEVAKAVDALDLRVNEQGYDPWGFCPEEAKKLYSSAYPLYTWFRPELHGIEHIPAGRVLVVSNHSGQVPMDGLVITVSCLLKAQPPRILRAMADRWVPTIPYVNEVYSRAGVVLGDPANCRNLLEEENAILVFPEGTKGIGKQWPQRYQLAEFGRGFMRLALQTRSPIVPVAVVGAEESVVSVGNFRPLAQLLGIPFFPVSPWLPVLGPLAYLPMPVKFHIYFGEPMLFEGDFDDEDAVIQQKTDQVRAEIQRMINEGRKARKSLFF